MQLPTIYAIRHGQSEANKAGVYYGRKCSPLTPEGVKSAMASGEFLRTINFQKAFVSPQLRTRQTFDALGLSATLPVEYDERIMEVDMGEWEGIPQTEFGKLTSTERLFEQPDHGMPGGESVNMIRERISAFLSEKVQGSGGPVLVVGHSFSLRLLFMVASGDEQFSSLSSNNCQVWKIESGSVVSAFDPSVSEK